MSELLIEIYCENIPAGMQKNGADKFAQILEKEFSDYHIEHNSLETFYTPHRIVVKADGFLEKQPNRTETRKGPRLTAPEKAMEGFLKSVGMSKDQLKVVNDPKGDFYQAELNHPGEMTKDLLSKIIPEAIKQIPWPKSMKWGSNSLRFVRPIQNILCLFDKQVVQSSLDIGKTSIQFSNITKGHYFQGPDNITVKNTSNYFEALEKAGVVITPEERENTILQKAKEIAEKHQLVFEEDQKLIKEVIGLVETPVVLMGKIDKDFMKLPKEVLSTSMKTHQKYFPLYETNGKISQHFIVVSNLNIEAAKEQIIAGNERVLRARLSDALFFWNEDQKAPLIDKKPQLENIIFHAKIGTLAEKINRMKVIGEAMAQYIPQADKTNVERAIELSKTDLVSEMVKEFPDLQGLMGYYYALHNGEEKEVAQAISEHYAPLGPSDDCPAQDISVIVALSDKIDTLFCLFAIEEKPTGSKDPFALRRAALGIIRIILQHNIRLSLKFILDIAAKQNITNISENRKKETISEVLQFIAERLKVYLKEKGLSHDLIGAVFEHNEEDDLFRLILRAKALKEFLQNEEGNHLLTAYRRANNIVRIEEKKDKKTYNDEILPNFFEHDEEKYLYKELNETDIEINSLLENEEYEKVMQRLAQLRSPVDAFFDHVQVNCDDQNIRANRLKLLSKLKGTMSQVANFSKIEQ